MEINKVLIIFAIFIVIISLFSFYQYYYPKREWKKLEPSLYANFTPYMKEKVDSHLGYIGCKPLSYYFEDDAICFDCESLIPCFPYWLVERAEGKRMIP